ncbi:yjeF C-terminal region, hydroxyethylthiazole kinase-related/yjeF N-terminal region [Pseudorhodobacter antarcticus]|uniref:Bifunctional NAD(P)H-hydrate repair enzyme n=1 Tax=Pseudorhodobacter antarcticus TaxID=1077947 RepID=A0A1H8D6H6_9RHOB|nr:bifunctional ADP-dependent NAD(P)H-hydrate dehydratase/NAD(P)H-hydrate epimerase [Pseudorhodobacter antarcticus]SEN02900.1 yjeF C-terminal region, hydroxyethylthiazole kinase-related/yjeF N-terminal region [Pseudorhodobacter antarcticus]
MTELLTAAQMRALEAAAIASGAVTGLELMERAWQGVVAAIFEEWPDFAVATEGGAAPQTDFYDAKHGLPPRYLDQDESSAWRAVVLCGPGNNGGDGFVVARLLHDVGWAVEVYLYGDPARLPQGARLNYERWCELGVVTPLDHKSCEWVGTPTLLIDALFGTGLTRALPDDLQGIFRIIAGLVTAPYHPRYRRCVAVDLPSGIDADTGKCWAADFTSVIRADLSVTFLTAKIGHFLGDPFSLGKLVVKPLGLPGEPFLERGFHNEPPQDRRVKLVDQRLFGKATPILRNRLGKAISWNKFDNGHALILSGGIASAGAARLAARGALRIGAGVVTVGCPPAALMVQAAQLTAVIVRAVRDAAALDAVLADARINALCLGPGLGLGAREAALVATALARRREPRATVLDADALTLIARDAALFDLLHGDCVLTPHAGEFARLFPDLAAKVAEPATKGPTYSKVDATRDAAKRAGCVVLFKGPDTVIAAPDGRCSINAALYDRAAPWLATAGSGDVLAGFITGLLARGFAPMDAAETAAWLHVECARSFGPGLIAEDVPEELPKVFRALGL